MIQTFPTFIYSDGKGLKIGKGALECAVCLDEFEDDETLRLLFRCDLVFHPECIDAWLAFHTTCPFCSANLVLDSGQITTTTSADLTHVPDQEDGSDIESRISEIDEAQNQISIRSRDIRPEVINPTQIQIQNRPARSSRRDCEALENFLDRSTSHSIVQLGENCERFTLRLPENMRKQIVSRKLVSLLPREMGHFPAGVVPKVTGAVASRGSVDGKIINSSSVRSPIR